jgi:hypothetical protein
MLRRRVHATATVRQSLTHAYLRAAVDADLEVVHDPGNQRQAPTPQAEELRLTSWVALSRIEAAAAVRDGDSDTLRVEGKLDDDVRTALAVVDGVGAGLVHAHHDVIDRLWIDGVETQEEQDLMAQRRQPGCVGGHGKAKSRRRSH